MSRSQQCRPERARGHRALAILALVCVGVCTNARDARAQEPDPPGGSVVRNSDGPAVAGDSGKKAPAEQPLVRGQLSTRYWLRWAGDGHDQDLFETLSLDIGDERTTPVSGHFLGRLAADLDGNQTGSSRFFSLTDTFGDSVNERIYDAYVDLHRVPGLVLVRAGRQMIHDTPELAYFDGLRLETQPAAAGELQLGAYGGVSSHLFEASTHGDWTAGLYAQARPWTGGRVRLDWMHLEDEVLLGAHDNDLFGAGLWQTVGDRLQLEGQYTRIEGRDRDVRTRMGYSEADSELMAQLTYYELLHTQRDLVLELDPFFDALHELFPYWQLGGLVSKGLWQHTDLQLGADLRRVRDRGEVGLFNRDYERWFTTFSMHDLLVTGLTVGATADLWHSNGQEVHTWGADIEQKLGASQTVSLGTYYSLYKFDLYLNSERDHVRTYYGKLQHKPSKAVSLEISYELEEADLGEFQVLRMGVTWRF